MFLLCIGCSETQCEGNDKEKDGVLVYGQLTDESGEVFQLLGLSIDGIAWG